MLHQVRMSESFPPRPMAGEFLCLWTCLFDSLDCLKRTGVMMLTYFFRGSFKQGCSLAGKRKRNLIACTKNYLYFLCIFLAISPEFIPLVITCTVLCNTVKCVFSYIPSIKLIICTLHKIIIIICSCRSFSLQRINIF